MGSDFLVDIHTSMKWDLQKIVIILDVHSYSSLQSAFALTLLKIISLYGIFFQVSENPGPNIRDWPKIFYPKLCADFAYLCFITEESKTRQNCRNRMTVSYRLAYVRYSLRFSFRGSTININTCSNVSIVLTISIHICN